MIRPADAVVVVAGGMLGTTARAGLSEAFPAVVGQWPWTTLVINLVGSLLLGLLVEILASWDDTGWRRRLRLGAGTGMLGGFTTYSTFSVETVGLFHAGAGWLAVSYATLSLALGIAAATAAMAAVRLLRRAQEEA